MRRRTTRNPASRSDYGVATTKRKPFPARTGIQRASETEQVPSTLLRELEELKLRVRTLNSINTNLRRQIHKLTAQMSAPASIAGEHAGALSNAEQTKK